MGMKHEIRHPLSLELAKKAIDKAMEAYSARFSDFNPQYEWKTENMGMLSFRAKGVSVEGSIEIVDDKIFVDLDVPWILRVFKGKAMEVIDSEVKQWVEKAQNGELDDPPEP